MPLQKHGAWGRAPPSKKRLPLPYFIWTGSYTLQTYFERSGYLVVNREQHKPLPLKKLLSDAVLFIYTYSPFKQPHWLCSCWQETWLKSPNRWCWVAAFVWNFWTVNKANTGQNITRNQVMLPSGGVSTVAVGHLPAAAPCCSGAALHQRLPPVAAAGVHREPVQGWGPLPGLPRHHHCCYCGHRSLLPLLCAALYWWVIALYYLFSALLFIGGCWGVPFVGSDDWHLIKSIVLFDVMKMTLVWLVIATIFDNCLAYDESAYE